MDPSSAQHHQDMANETLESMLVCTKSQQQEMKKPRPQQEQALRCPRCDSANTKFCYYNNYSLTQPRYFCKSCRRYWTKGGTLRNVPVGGGCRKTKRSSSKRSQDQQPMINNNQMINPLSNLPSLTYDTNDLSLAFARLQKQPNGVLGFHNHHDHHEQLSILSNPNDTHFDLLGNPSGQILGGHRNGGFLDGFYNNNSHNNMFSGYGMGLENLGNNVSGGDQEMGGVPSFEDLNVNVKQEYCNIGGRDVSENRVLFGFPWQIGGGGADHGNIVGGGGYNGSSIGGSTNWHGLINSPLM